MSDVIVGLDLGQASDPTALAVIRRTIAPDATAPPVPNQRSRVRVTLDVVHIERYPLLTSYPEVVSIVKALVRQPGIAPSPRLAIDATGVGRAVSDMFIDAGIEAEIYPITLTSGETPRRDRWNHSGTIGYWVPKNETITLTRTLLQTGRLRVAKGIALAEVLRRELLDFRARINERTARTSFNARVGAHDDVLLSVAIAVWLGMRTEVRYRGNEKESEFSEAI
jgi:hypothetical protein